MPTPPRRWLRFSLWTLFVLAALAVIPLGWIAYFGWRSVTVADVNHPATFTISPRLRDGFPMSMSTGMSLWITGEINGMAEIWAEGCIPQKIEGRVDSQWHTDWYSDECVLFYKPLGPVSGQLVIHYKFE